MGGKTCFWGVGQNKWIPTKIAGCQNGTVRGGIRVETLSLLPTRGLWGEKKKSQE